MHTAYRTEGRVCTTKQCTCTLAESHSTTSVQKHCWLDLVSVMGNKKSVWCCQPASIHLQGQAETGTETGKPCARANRTHHQSKATRVKHTNTHTKHVLCGGSEKITINEQDYLCHTVQLPSALHSPPFVKVAAEREREVDGWRRWENRFSDPKPAHVLSWPFTRCLSLSATSSRGDKLFKNMFQLCGRVPRLASSS